MHPSKHVRRAPWPAAARVAVAIVGGALLCTATTVPALASTRHTHAHKSHAHKTRSHKPATHKPAKSSAQSSVSGEWAYYTVLTAAGSKPPLYELGVKRESNGDLSMNVFQLGSADSAPMGSGAIRPGSILVLPASGSTPTGAADRVSAQPPASSGWADSYTVPTAQAGESQVLDELIVKRAGNGDLSLNVFQLGGGSSSPEGSAVIKPGWVLVLPANGSAPAAPTGPLAESPQAVATPITGQGTPAGATQPSVTQHSGSQHDATQQNLTSAVAPTSATLARAGEIGAIVLIVLLVGVWLLIKRRRGSQRAGKPDRRDPRRLALRPIRRGRAASKRGSTVAGSSSPTLAGDRPWAVGDNGPPPALMMPVPVPVPVPVPALAGGAAPSLAGGSTAAGGGMTAGSAGLDDTSWPRYLVPAGAGSATTVGTNAVRSPEISHWDGSPVPARPVPASPVPASLRDETNGVCAQRHQVVSGDDQIEVMLAQAPAAGQGGGSGWLARSPYLVWTPLPYDIPRDGLAFTCLGTGDKGCLFIDLAAAPGVISIGGDRAAAARLAESIAHQVSMAGHSGPLTVTVVGDAVRGPLPVGVTEVATVADLGPAHPGDATAIVFCAPCSDEETTALARYTAAAQHRVIPVVLADMPDAAWSFTAQPSLRPSQPQAR
jgi:hypothetical protein